MRSVLQKNAERSESAPTLAFLLKLHDLNAHAPRSWKGVPGLEFGFRHVRCYAGTLVSSPLDFHGTERVRCPDLWSGENWYAVQTKPIREVYAAANVAKLDVRVLLPKLKARIRCGGKRRFGVKPLFPGYFFARFVPEAKLEGVRHAHGVIRVISSGRTAIPVDVQVVEEIKSRIGADGLIEIGRPHFHRGDRVRIEDGPLQGLLGTLERESSDSTRVTLLLESLIAARVVVDSDCLGDPDGI